MTAATRQNVVITGGNGGLARAIAARFGGGGWHVEAPGRDALDVADARATAAFFTTRTPDLLVCNAGVVRDKPLARLSADDWRHVIDVNFHGARRGASACIENMAARGSGHILFISSHSAIHPPAGQAAYATAKAALLGLTQGLAAEAGPHGVRVNAILPGFLETAMTNGVTAARREEFRTAHTLGRFNTPTAVAGFLWHLQHDLPHTSGQVFQLDSRVSG